MCDVAAVFSVLFSIEDEELYLDDIRIQLLNALNSLMYYVVQHCIATKT